MTIYLFTLIKDEQRYLDEWIEYNLSIGFDKIVLYEEFNSSPHDISKYGDKVILYKTPDCYNELEKEYFYSHVQRQYVVYTHFNRVHRNECDWFAFLDVDEFIEHNNIKNIINDKYDVISMYFKFYSYSGHIQDPYPNEIYSVRDTYKTVLPPIIINSIAHLDDVYKSLCKSSSSIIEKDATKAEFLIPHSPIRIDRKEHKFINVPLAHYWTRSLDEYINKLYNQGLLEDEWYSRRLDDFFVYNRLNIEDYKEYVKDYIDKKPKTNEDY